jgi:hypothetical protein
VVLTVFLAKPAKEDAKLAKKNNQSFFSSLGVLGGPWRLGENKQITSNPLTLACTGNPQFC